MTSDLPSGKTVNRMPFFSERDIKHLASLASKISQFTDISYEFVPDGFRVKINGIAEEVTCTHPASARALLDGFLEGYNLGYGDGREDCHKELGGE